MIKLKAILVLVILNEVSRILVVFIASLIEFRGIPWALMMTVRVSQWSLYQILSGGRIDNHTLRMGGESLLLCSEYFICHGIAKNWKMLGLCLLY